MAALYGLIIHQIDVKTAFLNEELDEEIYMHQPEGFIADGQESKVCRLLYVLKQVPKQWHEKVDSTLIAAGFVVNELTLVCIIGMVGVRLLCYAFMLMTF